MASRINKDILVLLRFSRRMKTAMNKVCGALSTVCSDYFKLTVLDVIQFIEFGE